MMSIVYLLNAQCSCQFKAVFLQSSVIYVFMKKVIKMEVLVRMDAE